MDGGPCSPPVRWGFPNCSPKCGKFHCCMSSLHTHDIILSLYYGWLDPPFCWLYYKMEHHFDVNPSPNPQYQPSNIRRCWRLQVYGRNPGHQQRLRQHQWSLRRQLGRLWAPTSSVNDGGYGSSSSQKRRIIIGFEPSWNLYVPWMSAYIYIYNYIYIYIRVMVIQPLNRDRPFCNSTFSWWFDHPSI